MSFFKKLLGKKEKKTPTCSCKICKTLLEEGEGHVLVSAQVISSKKYWDNVMIEPETKSYTIAHFEKQDSSATQMRNMIFLRSANFANPWTICDTCVKMFEVDYDSTQANAQEWWNTEQAFRPDNCGKAEENLASETYEDYQKYAVMEAGKESL